jgi:hypothetical protein
MVVPYLALTSKTPLLRDMPNRRCVQPRRYLILLSDDYFVIKHITPPQVHADGRRQTAGIVPCAAECVPCLVLTKSETALSTDAAWMTHLMLAKGAFV